MVPAELWKKYTQQFQQFQSSHPTSQQSLSQTHARNDPPKTPQTKNVDKSKPQHTKKT
tara:strand:- start:90 stop:263 length:174 start_codon:yes stop_codon:yes gene_type:complete